MACRQKHDQALLIQLRQDLTNYTIWQLYQFGMENLAGYPTVNGPALKAALLSVLALMDTLNRGLLRFIKNLPRNRMYSWMNLSEFQ